ncbi:hypothetical protein IAR55_002319 [Kwoniella newhampshirensis]|uniref:Pep3/Vps18/deep orange domain-containing protein n=1 Tax=Kwoniella newhampshirensis TaxID=1651941 RepID=A0AAW0YQS0_9TREE
MSMLDDFVEHTSGPSIPPRYSSSGAYRGSGPVATLGGSGIEAVGYEGFEVDDGEEEGEDTRMVQALETGFIPSSQHQIALPPLFSLSLVQYSPPSSLLCLTTANNLLFLAAAPLSVIIIDLDKPEELVTIDLPKPAAEKGSPAPQTKDMPSITQLYADPTARHLLITTTSGDTFYLPISPGNAAVQSRRPRPLRLRQTITAVGWSPISGNATVDSNGGGDVPPPAKGDAITPPATDVLLGTTTGQVLSLPLPPQDDIFKSVSIGMSKPLEKDLQMVYTLPDQQPVTGIGFGFWWTGAGGRSSGRKTGEKRAWAVMTTKERLYEVQGNVGTTIAGGKTGGWAEELFKPFREGAPKFQELPGDMPNSLLKFYIPSVEGQSVSSLPAPSALAWLTAPGLYTSSLATSNSSEILTKPSLLPYPSLEAPAAVSAFSRQIAPTTPSIPPTPIAVAMTQWHWLLLYSDRIVGVSKENEKMVWEEALPLTGDEHALGLSADPVSRTFWIYTDRSIFEVLVRNEDRDVWRAKLEKGDYDEAIKFVHTSPQKDIVLSRQADALFEQGRFIQSAQCYAQSSRSFEYVTLQFVDADERDALRIYLAERLDRLDKRERTQRMMLATWLVEMYLSKCNTLEDIVAAESVTSDVESLTIERQMTEEDLKNFTTTYQSDLEPKVVYELILSHGRTDLYLFYANLNKDFGKVVEHWVTEEKWLRAIDVLNRQNSVELYYRFAAVLMRNAPKETVDAWMRQPSLSPRYLIPALLQQQQRSEPITGNHAVRYLSHVINQQGSTDTTIYNLLLTFYASDPDPDDTPLIRFLSSCPDDPTTDRPYYDLDYALRTCKQNGRIQPCVLIYSKLGLYESSVDLALEKGDMELAKINADRPEDDDVLRKKLWLKIAKYVVQEQKDIKSAMRFLESTDLVKIEDILPFFPDFVVIDDFKAEICSALEDYSARIDELKAEMDEATASAESIKRDIENLTNRFVTIEPGDKCWKCGLGLVIRQFYVFPCQHSFHADCLISMAMGFLPAPTLRRILHLQDELVSRSSEPTGRALLSSSFSPAPSGTGTPRHGKDSSRNGATSGSAATDLLLGMTGRNKLIAAGDRLREMIIPDALAQAVSVVGAGVGVTSGGGSGAGKKGAKKRDRLADEGRVDELRKELDELVAGQCPLCEGVVIGLDKPFIVSGEDTADWEV